MTVTPLSQDRAVVEQRAAHPPFQAGGGGASPTPRLHFSVATVADVNPLLADHHYLGPMKAGRLVLAGAVDGELVAAQVWRNPTSRHLPQDGTWLELSRWCLTPAAGANAGSKMQAWAVKYLRRHTPITTLVSYSDPSVGHTGALYRASGWWWAPTWLRLRPPPTANGDWGGKGSQAVKDRWIYDVRPDIVRSQVRVNDTGALRRYLQSEEWATVTYRWRSTLLVEAVELGLVREEVAA